MYRRDLETDAEAMEQHNANQRKVAAERLKKVAALVKLKKNKESKND
jgi:hypothetical protein